MNLYRVIPDTEMLSLDDPEAAELLRTWFRPHPGWTWALVSTPSGDTIDAEGASRALSNPVDRAVLTSMRDQSEAVILGGATVRAERVPIPRSGPLVVVSRTGDVSGHRIPEQSFRPAGVWVITPETAALDPTSFFPPGIARHIRLPGTEHVSPRDVERALQSEGITQVLVEAGRDFGDQCMDENLVDSLNLTLTKSPRTDSHPPLPWWREQWGQWTCGEVFTDDQRYLYLRYRREQDSG